MNNINIFIPNWKGKTLFSILNQNSIHDQINHKSSIDTEERNSKRAQCCRLDTVRGKFECYRNVIYTLQKRY